MPRTANSLLSLTAALLGAQRAYAQVTSGDVVWSTVVISTFGDRVPLYSPDLSVLTSLGAQQMYDAGSFFRARYIKDINSRANLPGISEDSIDNAQTFVQTTTDVFIQQSASAFMNGLYPPLTTSNQSSSTLANGSTITGPFGGLQYPLMNSYSQNDPNYYSLSASTNCLVYPEELRRSYTDTNEFYTRKKNTQDMYNSINATVFQNAIPNRSVGYGTAYEVWDYFNYMRIHNATIANTTSENQLLLVREDADLFARSTVGNTSNPIMSMTGRALGQRIRDQFVANYDTSGNSYKLNPIFTSWEPILSLMSLMGMPSAYPDLNQLPDPGSSLVFEMFQPSSSSSGSLAPTNVTFSPDPSSLYVRAFFRNGSDSSSQFSSYSMPNVGNNSQSAGVLIEDFVQAIADWEIMPNFITDWCSICSSNALFCVGADPASTGQGGVVTVGQTSSSDSAVSPAVAGVIGAIVSLAVAGLILLAAMLLGGFRMRRDRPSVVAGKAGLINHKRRKSDMGGFKGREKMASDVDLPAGVAPVGASVVPTHNRTSSWEMKEPGARVNNRDSENTFVGAPGPEISETAGISIVKDEDEELGDLKPVKERESF